MITKRTYSKGGDGSGMAYLYPLFLSLFDRRCVVVGGGDVAARKAARLIECGAHVAVIATSLAPEMQRLNDTGSISHTQERYRAEHLEGAFLVIGATDEGDINRRVYRDAEDRGILVNIVDDPERCNFIVPAVARRGDLTVAVSTGGKSPLFAGRIRDELDSLLDEAYAPFLRLMGELRTAVLSRGNPSRDNRLLFESLADSSLFRLVRERQWDEAEQLIFKVTGERIAVSRILGDDS